MKREPGYIYFHDGSRLKYTPPANTADPRYIACTDHRAACDCREALLAEEISEARAGSSHERPTEWPPEPGSLWQDRTGDRWIGAGSPDPWNVPYLVCIAKRADDSAEEVWRLFGPLIFIQYIAPTEEEPPF